MALIKQVLLGVCTTLFCGVSVHADVKLFPTIRSSNLGTAPTGVAVVDNFVGDQNWGGLVSLVNESSVGQLAYSLERGFYLLENAKTPMGLSPKAVVSFDVNQDGHPDFAVFEEGRNAVNIFLWSSFDAVTKLITFQEQHGISTSFYPPDKTGPEAVLFSDLNRDGRTDLISVGSAEVGVVGLLLNEVGGGGMNTLSVPTSLASADFDQDGYPDLAVTAVGPNALDIKYRDNSTTFTYFGAYLPFYREKLITLATGTDPWGITTTDFNGDGKADLAVANRGSGSVSVFLGTGVRPIIDTDIGQTGGDKAFKTLPQFTVCTNPVDILSGDFNHDSKKDLIIACDDGTLQAFAGNGDGTFNTNPLFSQLIGKNLFKIVSGDFNHDGADDLLVSSTGTNELVTLIGNAAPILSNPVFQNGLFQITFTDPEGDLPSPIEVVIDGTPHNLTEVDPADQNTKDGKVYQTTVTLTAGAHQYYFSASDGTSPATGSAQIPLQTNPANLNLTESVPFVNAGSGGGCSLTASASSNASHSMTGVLFLMGSAAVFGFLRVTRRG